MDSGGWKTTSMTGDPRKIAYLYFIYFLTIVNAIPQNLEASDIELFEENDDLERDKRAHRETTCDQLFRTESTPYVAIILSKYSGNFLCMGSIIDPLHVLTVRECLLRDDIDDLLVLAGYMSPYWGKNAQVKHVQQVVKSEYDLAILKLRKKFIIGRTIKPITISANPPTDPHKIYGETYGVVGIARSRWDVPGEPMPKTSIYELKFATLMANQDVASCVLHYSDLFFNSTYMFCTYSNLTFCWGSLGAPSVVLVDEHLIQMGIVVRAYCDEKDIPNLLHRLDFHQPWILSNSNARGLKMGQ